MSITLTEKVAANGHASSDALIDQVRRLVETASQEPAAQKSEERPVQRSYAKMMVERIEKVNSYLFGSEKELLSFGYRQLDSAFGGGIQPGLYLIPGQTNIGKTAFMTNLALTIAKANPNAAVLYFSLDENELGVVPRLVSCLAALPIHAVKFPGRYASEPGILKRRADGFAQLTELAKEGRFCLFSSSDGNHTVEWVEDQILTCIAESKDKQFVVFIDFLHDLLSEKGFDDEQTRLKYVVQVLMDLSREYYLPIFMTAELRKLNKKPGARPHLEDVRETVRIIYKMDAVLMLYNEMALLGHEARVYWQHGEERMPVLEAHIQKTRYGSKHVLFFNFLPEQSRLLEPTEEACKFYYSRLKTS